MAVWALPALARPPIEHFAWTDTRGAPGDVASIAQTPDRLLWLATDRGLVRFDGEHFQTVSLTPPDASRPQNLGEVKALPDGSLMVAYRSHGLARYFPSTGKTEHFRVEDGLPMARIFNIVQFQGRFVVNTIAGVYWRDGSRWQKWDFGPKVGHVFIDLILGDSSGTLFLKVEGGGWFRSASPGQPAEPAPELDGVGNARIQPDGSWQLWRNSGELVQRHRDGRQQSRQLPLHAVPNWFLIDPRGDAWAVDSARGLVVLPNVFDDRQPLEARFFTPATGLSGPSIFGMMDDQQGNVWVGTTTGLDRFTRVAVHPTTLPGYDGGAITAAQEGGIWVTRPEVLPFRVRPDLSLQRTSGTEAMRMNGGTAAFQARDGQVFIGGYEHVWRVVRGRSEELAPMPPAASHRLVQSLADAPDGSLWMSLFDGGLWVWQSGQWSARDTPELAGDCTILAATPDGIAAGFDDGRLVLVNDGPRESATLQPGLGRLLAVYPKGGQIWLGGDKGVALWRDGRLRHLRLDGDSIGRVTGIVESAGGDLWLNESSGLIRVAASALSAWIESPPGMDAPVRAERFGPLDGVHGGLHPNRTFPSLVQESSGRMWMTRANAVFWFEPSQMMALQEPLRPLIVSASVDEVPVAPPERLVVRTPEQQVRLVFAGTDLRNAVATQFRVMVEGLDQDWTPLGTNRRFALGGLPPGQYRVKVQASTPREPWNDAATAWVDVDVKPAWHQSTAFRGAILMLALIVASLLYRARIRWLLRRWESRMDIKLKERESVARDLHDSLLQSIVAVVLQVQRSLKGLAKDHPVRLRVEDTLGRAERVVGETREQLLSVRGEGAARDLASALQKELVALLTGEGWTLRLCELGRQRAIHPIVVEELRAIVLEAARNAVAHSGGRELVLDVTYGRRQLQVRVEDDGQGMAQSLASGAREPPLHFGLRGMKERAELIGGRITWTRAVHGGTSVRIRVPAGLAYASR